MEYYTSSELLDALYDAGAEQEFIYLCEDVLDKKIWWDNTRGEYVVKERGEK